MEQSWDKLAAVLEECEYKTLANHIHGDEQRTRREEQRHKEVNSGVSGPRRLREGNLTIFIVTGTKLSQRQYGSIVLDDRRKAATEYRYFYNCGSLNKRLKWKQDRGDLQSSR